MTERIHNINIFKERRKKLRNSLTPAEAKLWSLLKNSQLENKKFRRQHSVGPYILDFYCPSEKLCIEMDGSGHFSDGGYAYDTERTEYLRSLNIKVIRFENKEIFDNPEGVLEEIKKIFSNVPPLYCSPPVLGGDKEVVSECQPPLPLLNKGGELCGSSPDFYEHEKAESISETQ